MRLRQLFWNFCLCIALELVRGALAIEERNIPRYDARTFDSLTLVKVMSLSTGVQTPRGKVNTSPSRKWRTNRWISKHGKEMVLVTVISGVQQPFSKAPCQITVYTQRVSVCTGGRCRTTKSADQGWNPPYVEVQL